MKKLQITDKDLSKAFNKIVRKTAKCAKDSVRNLEEHIDEMSKRYGCERNILENGVITTDIYDNAIDNIDIAMKFGLAKYYDEYVNDQETFETKYYDSNDEYEYDSFVEEAYQEIERNIYAMAGYKYGIVGDNIRTFKHSNK